MIGFTIFHLSEITDLIYLTKFEPINFNFEIFAFALLGIICGLVGASFVYTTSKLIFLRINMAYPMIHSRFRYTLLIAAVCAIVNYTAPFLQLSDKTIINQMFRAEKLSSYEQLYWNNPSTLFNLALYVILKLSMTALSISCQIPCGFVAPIFTGGAALGRLFGYIVDMILGTEHKGIYAVVGAACLVSSVTHTLSIAVIVFELTGQMNYILPMMIGVLISYSVSSSITMSMYNVILHLKQLPYIPLIKPSALHSKNVLDLSSAKTSLTQTTNLRQITLIISRSSEYAKIPIVDESNYLVGEISIESLKKLIVENYTMNSSSMTSNDKDFLDKHLSPLLITNESYVETWDKDSESSNVTNFLDGELIIDNDLIDFAPLSVPENLSLIKVQFMFIMMGLIQIYVVSKGKLVGVISRESFTKKQ